MNVDAKDRRWWASAVDESKYRVTLEPAPTYDEDSPRWRVYQNDVLLGMIERGERTWERRTRGRRYVNSRGQTRAWYVGYLDELPRRGYERDTRNAAIRSLVDRALEMQNVS
jgi:hypothetical protein